MTYHAVIDFNLFTRCLLLFTSKLQINDHKRLTYKLKSDDNKNYYLAKCVFLCYKTSNIKQFIRLRFENLKTDRILFVVLLSINISEYNSKFYDLGSAYKIIQYFNDMPYKSTIF